MLMLRGSLSPMTCTLLSNTILDNLKTIPAYQSAPYIYCYASYNNEVDTIEIINSAFNEGKRVALPCSYTKDGIPHMDFYEIHSVADLVPGYKGILEPDRRKISVKKAEFYPSIVIVPVLAFDSNRYRVGYGKGFYDYYFNTHDYCLKIGLAYGLQQVDKINCDSNDVPLDFIVTENGVIYG